MLQSIGASVLLLPLDECILTVFLTKVSQCVHCGHTKVDHYGVGTGFGEAAKAYKHPCHLFALLGLWDICLPNLTTHEVFLSGLFGSSSSLSSRLPSPISRLSLDPRRSSTSPPSGTPAHRCLWAVDYPGEDHHHPCSDQAHHHPGGCWGMQSVASCHCGLLGWHLWAWCFNRRTHVP